MKQQIAKLQAGNEAFIKENSDLKKLYSVNQEKLRESLNKLESNDRELILCLTENKKLSRFNQDLQQENLILTKNLKESENFSRELSQENSKNKALISRFREELADNSKEIQAFNAKTEHLLSEIEKNEEFFINLKENEHELLRKNEFFREEIENSLKKALNFFLKLDPSLKILLKNPEKPLEFIVKAQDFFLRKNDENTEFLLKVFRISVDLLLKGIEESLIELNKQMEISAKDSQKAENLSRDFMQMKREAVFAKDEEKELKREVENLKISRNYSEKEKEKALNE